MAALPPAAKKYPIKDTVKQSPPIDLHKPYNLTNVKDQTIIVTGGASGFGAGFVQQWAAAGACVVVGDINTAKGEKLVAELRQKTGNDKVHFVRCNVTIWKDQVALFRRAIEVSPHGGIDHVVANAGIAGGDKLQLPMGLDKDDPPAPDLSIVNVNLNGVLYTTHLAFYYLPRNSTTGNRDRHLLLMGSLSSVAPFPSQGLYAAAKHGVLGLFRSLRGSSFAFGMRVNILFPYFIDTPLLDGPTRVILAGAPLGKTEDVVDGASRFVADASIKGRGLMVGPKVYTTLNEDGDTVVLPKGHKAIASAKNVEHTALWEAYADDFEDSDGAVRNIVQILNGVSELRGWAGFVSDVVTGFTRPVKQLIGWR